MSDKIQKNHKRISREEQVAIVQEALSNKELKEALIKSKTSKKTEDEADYRQSFSEFWAQNKKAYGKGKDVEIENILWLHLKATKNDTPDKFEKGVIHFGLKKR